MVNPQLKVVGIFMNKRHGGMRSGAGRPKGGKYGEKTTLMRIPNSLIDAMAGYIANKGYRVPLYGSSVSAGAPVPAEDDVEAFIDLNQALLEDPTATFLTHANGDSMINAGIEDGDLLIVDSKLKPRSGNIVIASVDGHTTVKRLDLTQRKLKLLPENDNYKPIVIEDGMDCVVLGVVTKTIKNML
jgi:DNA polymerase V